MGRMIHQKEHRPVEEGTPEGAITMASFAPPARSLPGASVTATQRMYWRSNGRLAYPAGAEYPADEHDDLVGEAELFNRETRDEASPERIDRRRKEYRHLSAHNREQW